MRWAPIAMMLLCGCSRSPAVGDADAGSQDEGPQCESDDECAFVPNGCCDGCGGGHPRITTRSRADWSNRLDALTCWAKDCPDFKCTTMPPCFPDHRPVCEGGRCVAVPVLPDECSDCTDACGPFPPEGLDCDPHHAEELWVACCNATRNGPNGFVDCHSAKRCPVDDASGHPPALIRACEKSAETP